MSSLWIPKWLEKRAMIETWFSTHFANHTPPIYASVDIRHNCAKISVIDTNLFSAGFNNLDAEACTYAIDAFQKGWADRCIPAKKILLIPERHTRNTFYHANLHALKTILEQAGSEVRIGYWQDSKHPELADAFNQLGWETIERENNHIRLAHWVPDLIMLNNDLSSGIPEILKDVEVPILPPPSLGWHARLKSTHFALYKQIVADFSNHLDIDPWSLHAEYRMSDHLDFYTDEGVQSLQDSAADLLRELKESYQKRDIPHAPYAVIKPDSGTYGMGIMTIHDASQLNHLNRKQRNKMGTIKDGMPVHRVLIQEGIRSEEIFNAHPAESVLYMVNQEVVGRFYRVHPNKDSETSLNAPGMLCEPVPLNIESPSIYLHSISARLALLAASEEAKITSASY
jgi:glutamate--cysteine ligase